MENQNLRPNYILIGVFVGAKKTETKTSTSGKEYSIREFRIKQSFMDPYGITSEKIFPLNVFGEKTSELDRFEVGDLVVVHFNLNASQDQEGKWKYINVNTWKIEMHPNNKRTSQPAVVPVQEVNNHVVSNEGEDDLPF